MRLSESATPTQLYRAQPMNVVVNSIMTNESDVIGVWRLRAYYLEIVESGERIEPFGPKPKGVFMIHPGGRVVVVMTPAEQIKPQQRRTKQKHFKNC